MATTRIRKGTRGHLYIKERMDALDMDDKTLAGRLGVARETVWRWRTEQHRLNPGKIAAIASALNCEPWELFRLPEEPPEKSLDALVKGADRDTLDTAYEIVERLVVRRR
jgi:transcriptional regulator with XRE-family HTH domain